MDKKKLHRHGNASIHITQKGDEVRLDVHGHKYDILHMLMAVIKRHARLGKLFEEAVTASVKEHLVTVLNTRFKQPKKKERSVN